MADTVNESQLTLTQRVEQVMELIRPAVQADGGDVEFVEINDAGVVSVRFHGACIKCPSSTMTLRDGIEKNLVDMVPEVTAVQSVT